MRRQNIHAGSIVAIQGLGGLGHLAVQFASKMGYRVVALSSSGSKEEFARELGAHDYLDGSKVDQAAELAKMGGASMIVATAPNMDIIKGLAAGLEVGGKILLLARKFLSVSSSSSFCFAWLGSLIRSYGQQYFRGRPSPLASSVLSLSIPLPLLSHLMHSTTSTTDKFLLVGGDVSAPTPLLIQRGLSIQGWPSGNALDCEETIAFAAQQGVKCTIEKFPFEKAQEAYEHMLSGKARFRSVITF